MAIKESTVETKQAVCNIAIIRGKEGTFRVVPGHVFVERGTPIVFTAVDTGPITLLFPDEALFGAEKRVIDVPEGGSTRKDHLVAEHPGNYPYCVFIDKARDFAVGDSHPRIVVKESDGN